MTHITIPRFLRRPLVTGSALAMLAVPVAMLATSGAASAATLTPGYHHQRCDETLTYVQEYGYGGDQFVIDHGVCNVVVFHEGGYGRHHQRTEDVAWQTERHGFTQDHFARDVRDVEVFH